MLLDAPTLTPLREERKAKKWINDIQFSAKGDLIAAASADGRVHVVDRNLTTICLVDIGVQREALRIDFDTTTSFLRIAYQPDHLVFFKLDEVTTVTDPLSVRDVLWATNSCPFSWNTQGSTILICSTI
jgi:WD40 repeat protein